MNSYTKHQMIASISVGLFIVYTAFILLVMNQSVYKRCIKDYKIVTEEGATVSSFEAELCFEQLSESFRRYFHKTDELGPYEMSGSNIKKISRLKGYYRMAWIIAIISLVMMLRSFIELSKRRLFMPFLYGGGLAVLLTGFHWLILMRAGRPVLSGVRDMILHEDYSYFSDGDMLRVLIPPEYARRMLFHYFFLVAILIALMALIRLYIIYRGRPHRF